MNFLTKTALNTLALGSASLLLGIWILILINIYNLIDMMGEAANFM